jgi:hypothetical protein
MQVDLNWYVVLPIAFWTVTGAFVVGYLIRQRETESPIKRRSSAASVASDAEDKLQDVGPVTTVLSPPLLLLTKKHRGRPTLPPAEYVDFDSHNQEHCLALRMLMQNPARLHPTLRFHFDPSVHDNAYFFMLHEMANQYISRILDPIKVTPTGLDPMPTDPTDSPSITSGIIPLRPLDQRLSLQ